ncbi:glycosyltransferase family 2 protein [Rhodovulum sp. DZ06]|uniref:glycosyltransferase family 2 protein n=1 Tax=Rhodovulum sp. DZ06 TaxID=3425126 RepID=UPI003D3568DB
MTAAAAPPPLCSIVIPVYNRAAELGATVQSCLAQDYGAVEVILVDDGSTDDSFALCTALAAAAHPPGKAVRAVRQANAGACAARNRGMEMAAGAFLLFLDSDDAIPPEKLSTQIGAMEREGTSCCIADYLVVDADGRPLRRVSNDYPPEAFVTGFRSPSNSAIIFRRAALPAGMRWNTALDRMQDLDFMLRALSGMPDYSYVPEALYHYRMHDGARISDRYATGRPYAELFRSMARHLRAHPPARAGRGALLAAYGSRLLRSRLRMAALGLLRRLRGG